MLSKAMAPIVIAVDLTFLTGKYTHQTSKHASNSYSITLDFINSMRMGDFYVYLTFIGIISVWSLYGLVCTLMVWVERLRKYQSRMYL